MLDELRDVAGQHELVAENVQEKVLGKLAQVVKSLKDERRKVFTSSFIQKQRRSALIVT